MTGFIRSGMSKKLVSVDLENKHKVDLSPLDDSYTAIIFVGANQRPPKAARRPATAHRFSRVDFLKISGTGKNALDFHIGRGRSSGSPVTRRRRLSARNPTSDYARGVAFGMRGRYEHRWLNTVSGPFCKARQEICVAKFRKAAGLNVDANFGDVRLRGEMLSRLAPPRGGMLSQTAVSAGGFVVTLLAPSSCGPSRAAKTRSARSPRHFT